MRKTSETLSHLPRKEAEDTGSRLAKGSGTTKMIISKSIRAEERQTEIKIKRKSLKRCKTESKKIRRKSRSNKKN